MIFALLLASLIGLSLGLLGSGGSIITLPVMVYIAGIPVSQAVGMSLVVVGGTSAVGSFLLFRQGEFAGRAAILFTVSGMIGAFYGAKMTHLVESKTLMLLFGGLMLIVGAALLRKRAVTAKPKSCHLVQCLAVGALLGVMTGFLGVGGGFLILPALILFAGLEMKTAIGTSLAIISLNSAAGVLGQLRYVSLDWAQTLSFLAVAVAGMFSGQLLSKRLSSQSLQRGFAWAVILLGLFLLAKNR